MNDASERLRVRLLSIDYDVKAFVEPLLARFSHFPVVANERCGSWYAHRFQKSSCYFKSTDGHVGTWNFSLKRLNLPVVTLAAKHGGCLILDASGRKDLPDSFSRTIPIWAAVMNRIVVRYREELGLPAISNWDSDLYTPSWLVSDQEKETISSLLDERVHGLHKSRAIVNPRKLVETLTRPLRPYWITPLLGLDCVVENDHYLAIICVSCSTTAQVPQVSFSYVPGAADDQESWARRLTPSLFWKHHQEIMRTANQTENKLVELIDAVIASEADFHSCGGIMEHCSALGDTGIFLGSRRAGRPPECWEHFDAILNVTDQEYPETDKCYYLQMPVEEGKRDRTELERWMAVGILFVAVHCSDKRVLIHCNQGRDRSVAVAMACVVLMCELKLPLAFRSKVNKLSQKSLYQCLFGEVQPNSDTLYKYSGLSKRLVKALMGREGRNLIQEWFRQELGLPQESSTLATKETLRVALHLIQQHRNEVSPTRSTMQKLNRFFMSSGYES